MSASARSAMSFEVGVRKPVSHPLRVSESEVASGMEEDDDEKQEMCRRLFERFMAFRGSGCPLVFPIRKVWTCPCVVYTMRVSIKKAHASWSHRTSRRFFPERRGGQPIPIYRVAGTGGSQVEQVVDRSGAPGELCRPGVVSINLDERYYLLELSRKKGVLHKVGSSAPWREVAVIRGMPGGRGITVTSHVKQLVLRLHDILFFLSGPSTTVDLRFSEKWFRLPAGWTEERLYAEDGFHIIDIASSVENLVSKLCDLRKQEEQEMERRKLETEEERERRLYEEEQRRVREEEERRKIREENEVARKRREEEEAAKPRERAPLLWDPALWLINEMHPAPVRCYSKFKLSMNSNKKVSCEFVDKVGLQEMLQRAESGEYVLPISKTAPASASSRARETLGFVEGYFDIETMGFGPSTGHYIDRSGLMVSPVLMLSRSAMKVLTISAPVRKLDIVMDDGMVMSCCFDFSVDIHCDDISSSELLKKDWAYHMFCKNIDVQGRISFSTLLVHLKKKLQLQLTEEELRLYSMSVIDGEEGNEDILELRRKQQEWVPPKPKELADVELHDCTLFPILWES
jgi:hypothetical protein